jgi:pimeloyl-ACP methyl ester carboxylesterase
MAVGLQEPAPIRTLEQLRAEAVDRAERNAYPLIGLDPAVVRRVLGTLVSLDRDEWASAWAAVGDDLVAAGRYEEAWRYYSFARWPVPISPNKRDAYRKALEAYLAHGKQLDPPLEVVRIPFEGSEIVGYLRLPAPGVPAPVVVAIGGLDSRKEDLTERFAPLLGFGVGSFTLDMPGTGEAPIKIAAGAERIFSRALDHLSARPDVDAARIALYGGSFGGYWAVKLAVLERDRLRGVVAQSPPIDRFFAAEFARTAFTNEEYLFDLGPAMMSLYDGVATIDDFLRISPQNSLVAQGFIGKPTAPMLVIAGVLDTQVPIADIDLLLHSGETPKEAWINPAGGHMGRQRHGWRDPQIFAQITTPWLLRCLG